ncbi:hypothetical protein G5C51_21510 [Streptomyces sp. A7024]|uniref:Uncharacterized protein n=1 Tax=Streptomyces coryli TaxID=1128680 RepID=A0A6G4U422_9ACTN|nr:hypothetical protein [Streptomyces coryli]
MMWIALYIAFGIVALWLLGEVLLQYKARLRWRLLAFFGFLGVVLGVLQASVPIIGLGVIIFGIGQVKVTLSYRQGYDAGWALRGGPGRPPMRRRPPREEEYEPEPAYGPGPGQGRYDDEFGTDPEPQNPYGELAGYQGYEQQPQAAEQTAEFSPFGTGPQPVYQAEAAGYDQYSGAYDTGNHGTLAGAASYDTGYDTGQYATQGYDTGQYATTGSYDQGYSDPYSGTEYATPTYYDAAPNGYDTNGYGYDTGQYPAQGYDSSYQATPPPPAYDPNAAWVPQQRDDSGQYPVQGTGYEEQYRY